MKGMNLKELANEFAAKNIDLALLTSPGNFAYASGVALADEETRKFNTGVRSAVLIARTGEAIVIVSNGSRHQTQRDSWIQDVRTYGGGYSESPLPRILEGLKEMGVAQARIGIEMDFLPMRLYQSLCQEFPQAQWVDCADAMAHVRSIKTPEEIALLRTAILATDRALAGAFTSLFANNTERDLARRIADNLYNQGADSVDHLWVYGGDKTTDKFRAPGNKRLEKGDIVRVDIGGVFQGYRTDVARMAIVGKPSAEQARIYQGLYEAHWQMIQAAKPGISGGQLIQVLTDAMQANGLPFPGRGLLTHSIGVVNHDYPIVMDAQETALLKENMVVAIEPYVVVGNEKFAVEDDVLLGSGDAQVLSSYIDTRQMWEIGA